MATVYQYHSIFVLGLILYLYIEKSEYLKGIATGYGTRIQIHQPGTFPFPDQEGMFLPAAMQTDIGLKLVTRFPCCLGSRMLVYIFS